MANLAAVILFILGVVIYRANKLRAANRLFGILNCLAAVWTINYGLIIEDTSGAVFHLRIGAGIAAFLPCLAMTIRAALLEPRERVGTLFKRQIIWVWVGVVLATITGTSWFIDFNSAPSFVAYHFGWVVQHLLIAGLLWYAAWKSFLDLKNVTGPSRYELIVGVIVFGSVVGAISAFLAFNGESRKLPPAVIILIPLFYAFGLSWAIIVRRIYDAKRLLNLVGRSISVILGTAGIFYVSEALTTLLWQNGPMAKVFASIIASGFGMWITQYFTLKYSELLSRDIAEFQQEVAALARSYNDLDQAVIVLEQLIAKYTKCTGALILKESTAGRFERRGVVVEEDGIVWPTLNKSRWITPSVLAEQASSANARRALKHLDDQDAAVVIVAQRSEQFMNIAVMLGERNTFESFTYHEIERITLMLDSVAVAMTMLQATSHARHAGQMVALGLLSASVAHEVKQPLRILRHFMNSLPDRYSDPAFRDEFFPVIPDELARMEIILSQFLRMGRSNNFTLKETSAGDIIREITTLVQAKASDYGVSISTDVSSNTTVYSDPLILKQAILNIILNGIEAFRDTNLMERTISICATLSETQLFITIQDTGPGLSHAVLEKLFEPYVTEKADGFGLGLFVTKEQITKIGGEIAAENRDSGGASFRLSIPRRQQDVPLRRPVGRLASIGAGITPEQEAALR